MLQAASSGEWGQSCLFSHNLFAHFRKGERDVVVGCTPKGDDIQESRHGASNWTVCVHYLNMRMLVEYSGRCSVETGRRREVSLKEK